MLNIGLDVCQCDLTKLVSRCVCCKRKSLRGFSQPRDYW